MTTIAVIFFLSSVCAGIFFAEAFTNKRFEVPEAKYPTLARIQNHFYVSNVTARQYEYEQKQAEIRNSKVEIDQSTLTDKKRQNRLELSLFDRQMRAMSGLPEVRHTPSTQVFGANYTPKVEIVPKGDGILVPVSGTAYVREFPRFNARSVGIISRGPVPSTGYTIGEYVTYPTVSSDVWYFSKTYGGYFWGGVSPKDFHKNLQYMDNPEGDSSNAVSSVDPRYAPYAELKTGEGPDAVVITANKLTAEHMTIGYNNPLIISAPNEASLAIDLPTKVNFPSPNPWSP